MKHLTNYAATPFKGALMILALVITLSSCNEDDVTPVPVADSIIGSWDGTYHYSGSATEYSYSLRIKSGGIIERTNGNSLSATVDGLGTWTLNGNQFSATYKNLPSQTITYTISGTYDAVANKLTGQTASSSQVIVTSLFTLIKM